MSSQPAARSTRQRSAIQSVMEGLDSFVSAQELHELLRDRGERVGLTTVYRNLQAMADRGEVDIVKRMDGDAAFRMCASDTHHHHLVCTGCGFSVEINNEDVEQWAVRAARRHGFSNVSHDLEIFGTCQECSRTP